MSSRSSRAWVARMLLGALLFAQMALASAAGEAPERSAARALAAPESMPCHQAAQKARNVNLCLADCLASDQSSYSPQLPALATGLAPVLIVPLVDRGAALMAAVEFGLPHPPAPPPRILFQSFLI